MMDINAIKAKLFDEVMEHLSNSQGSDLKSAFDKMNMPKEEGMEDGGMDMMPKDGMAIEKVKVGMSPMDKESMESKAPLGKGQAGTGAEPKGMDEMGAVDDGDEMDDDEIKEMLSKYM